jgi:carboxyl-terminal processing protease
VFVICITVVITTYATYNNLGRGYVFSRPKISEDSDENIDTIAEVLKNFKNIVDEYYIGEVDEQKVLDEAIKGYIKGLDDEYSEYMTAKEWEEYQINTLGNYVGIGIYMTQDESGRIVVVEPIEASPAMESGIKKDDIIVEVNGEDVTNQNLDIVSSKIKGDEGTFVDLKILRDNEYITLNVERRSIKVYHVTHNMLENNIGYIKLSTFDSNCSNEFKNAYEELKEQGATKLVLDLRDNTGGLVDEALEIADMMLPKGDTILITKDSKNTEEKSISKKDQIIDIDIAVLVNGYSASASEILVGALKDNNRATIIGKKTYGKGVIQNVFSLSDGSILKLTTAEYFTPNKIKINKIGIEPDYKVELPEKEENKEFVDTQLKEAQSKLN